MSMTKQKSLRFGLETESYGAEVMSDGWKLIPGLESFETRNL